MRQLLLQTMLVWSVMVLCPGVSLAAPTSPAGFRHQDCGELDLDLADDGVFNRSSGQCSICTFSDSISFRKTYYSPRTKSVWDTGRIQAFRNAIDAIHDVETHDLSIYEYPGTYSILAYASDDRRSNDIGEIRWVYPGRLNGAYAQALTQAEYIGTFIVGTKQIRQCDAEATDIEIDRAHSFSDVLWTHPATNAGNIHDVHHRESILLHELLHAGGLGHVDHVPAVVNSGPGAIRDCLSVEAASRVRSVGRSVWPASVAAGRNS